ncbi:MAG: hypothetical protein WBF05_03555 [Anaerolineales bacterium]
MHSELFVLIFNQDEETRNSLQALQMMRKSREFGLENAALVERDDAGKVYIHQYSRYPVWEPVSDDDFLIFITEAIFGDTQEASVRLLVEAGLDKYFLEEVANTLLLNSSALLIFFPQDSLVDTRQLLDAISKFKGALIHTTFPPQVIDSVLDLTRSE